MSIKTTTNGKLTTDDATTAVTIPAPNFVVIPFRIRGVAPYVQNKFSEKAREQMVSKQKAGSTATKGSKRDPKDFQAAYEQAIHRSPDGWAGIPAPAFRNALISACRTVGFQMTRSKLGVFCEPDGFDGDDGTPLVRITRGEPRYFEGFVRNETGVVDIRPRPKWDEGWEAVARIRFDADMFTAQDVANLMMRAGLQVGIGEGRPDSKKSAGLGWGLFELIDLGSD